MRTSDLKIDYCWNRIGIWGTSVERCSRLALVVHCKNCPIFIKTARRLLHTEPPEGYRSEWTKILARTKESKPFNNKSAFVFRAGNEWLALPAQTIQEVVHMGPIHSIPNINNKTLRGLVNIHGRLQICVSIGRVLGIEKPGNNEENPDQDHRSSPERLVVVLQQGNLVAFPVTEAKGTINYTPEMVKDPPVTVSGSRAVYTMGILHLDGRDIALLKDKPLFETLTKYIA